MTEQLTKIIKRVKTWPAWRQDDAAYLLQALEDSGTSVYRLSDEERFAVSEGLASEVVADITVEEFRSRHSA